MRYQLSSSFVLVVFALACSGIREAPEDGDGPPPPRKNAGPVVLTVGAGGGSQGGAGGSTVTSTNTTTTTSTGGGGAGIGGVGGVGGLAGVGGVGGGQTPNLLLGCDCLAIEIAGQNNACDTCIANGQTSNCQTQFQNCDNDADPTSLLLCGAARVDLATNCAATPTRMCIEATLQDRMSTASIQLLSDLLACLCTTCGSDCLGVGGGGPEPVCLVDPI